MTSQHLCSCYFVIFMGYAKIISKWSGTHPSQSLLVWLEIKSEIILDNNFLKRLVT